MSQVIIESLVKKYGKVVAVDDVSLEVQEGEFLTLLGPSGCGKTTTLRCVAGLEKPDGGRIYIGGKLANSTEERIFLPPEKRDVGMVFQSYAIWPNMTVFDNVAFGLSIRKATREKIEKRVAGGPQTGQDGGVCRPLRHRIERRTAATGRGGPGTGL